MDEQKIAAQLAAKTEEPAPPVVGTPETPPENPEPDQNFLNKLTPEEQLTKVKLMDYFGVSIADKYSPRVQDYMNTVYAWAREAAGTGDIYEILGVINDQERQLGITLKEARLNKLGEFVKIQRMRQQLATRERLLYGG